MRALVKNIERYLPLWVGLASLLFILTASAQEMIVRYDHQMVEILPSNYFLKFIPVLLPLFLPSLLIGLLVGMAGYARLQGKHARLLWIALSLLIALKVFLAPGLGLGGNRWIRIYSNLALEIHWLPIWHTGAVFFTSLLAGMLLGERIAIRYGREMVTTNVPLWQVILLFVLVLVVPWWDGAVVIANRTIVLEILPALSIDPSQYPMWLRYFFVDYFLRTLWGLALGLLLTCRRSDQRAIPIALRIAAAGILLLCIAILTISEDESLAVLHRVLMSIYPRYSIVAGFVVGFGIKASSAKKQVPSSTS